MVQQKIGALNKKEKVAGLSVSNKRFEIGFDILNRWLKVKQNGKSLTLFFEDNCIKTVAIYGMGALGERLYEELFGGGNISVVYAIDRIANSKIIPGLTIYGLEENKWANVDAIVITPVQDYWEIVGFLEERTETALLSLADIVDYCVDEI